MGPRVTVIIPTYNWSSVLPYSIGSVLDQTFDDFELLVIGDGCTDDSESVVAAIDDPRLRWINLNPGTGHQSGPNNEGLRQARGELIAYLGHDDLWLPHHLEALVAAIDGGAVAACSLTEFVAPEGEPIRLLVPEPARMEGIPPSAVLHPRRMAEAVGGWRDYRELTGMPDQDLWLRARAAGFAFTVVPRLTVVKFPAYSRPNVYRIRPFHEQAAWLARIRSEPDFEAVERAKLAAGRGRGSLAGYIRKVLRAFTQPLRWLAPLSRRKGARIDASKRFKGLRVR